MENKITKREIYEAILAAANNGLNISEIDENITDADVVAFCENEIELLDKKAAKAKERQAEKAAEGDAFCKVVSNALTDEYRVIAEIAADVAIEDPTATVSKVTNRLTQLVKNGVAEKKEVTIPGPEGTKARKLQAYRKCAE